VESPSTEEREGVGLACLFFPLKEGRRCMRKSKEEETEEQRNERKEWKKIYTCFD
jgi:hypothetical protein